MLISHQNKLHLLALAGGALVAHTLFGVVFLVSTTVDRIGLTIPGLIMIVLLTLLAVHLRNAENNAPAKDDVAHKIELSS